MEVLVFGLTAIMIGTLFVKKPTTIVLGDNDKKNNSIIIESKNGKTTITNPGEYVELKENKKIEIKKMSKEEMYTKFKDIIDNQPLKPTSILLYFKEGQNTLTKSSENKIDEILEEIKKRKHADLQIIGHTDTKGAESFNIRLSLKRAQIIEELIKKENINVDNIKVESYGESDLLVKTADNVSEAKNRRVEVIIK